MHLSSLTLKGFKSFARTTTIDLAPGLSVVVGPNGSGKSNIVDAIAWVLGSQAPTSLRSQQMDDVIFAGNPGRPALGRAEVTLTFNNEDRRLPLDLDEVAITRTLFRSGDSGYAINSAPARLIDISELLAAAGVGRHRHVIVSQGRIDSILSAKATERRTILEEAAGVSAYRLRREKALRRLGESDANLARLNDQLGEVRRALRPLERQAELARRHGALAAELTSLQIHRLGTELAGLRARRRAAATERRDLADRRAATGRQVAELDGRIGDAEARLSAVGQVRLVEATEQLGVLGDRVLMAQRGIEERRRDYERRQGARLASDLVGALIDEAARLEAELVATRAAEERAAPEFARIAAAEESLAAGVGAGSGATHCDPPDVVEALAAAEAHRREAVGAEALARRTHSEAAAELARHQARVDALDMALGDLRARSGMEVLAGGKGVLGALGDLVAVDAGWEAAFEAAAGEAMAAVVVDSPGAARPALEALARARLPGAVLPPQRPAAEPPPVGEPLRPHVRARQTQVREILDGLIGSVVVVPGWREACDALAAHPEATVVTPAGDHFSRTGWRVGVARAGATGEALAESRQDLAGAEKSLAAAERAVADAGAAASGAEASARSARAEIESRRAALVAERHALEVGASELRTRRRILADRLAEIRARLKGHEAAVATSGADAGRCAALGGLAERLAESARECRSGLEELRRRQRRAAEQMQVAAAELDGNRRRRARFVADLDSLAERLLAAQRAEDEIGLRIEAAAETLREKYGFDEARATGAAEPGLPDGVTLAGRIEELERLLGGIGPVNPLAVREHDELRERHDELASQIADVRSARRDLTSLVRSIDAEMSETFTRCFGEVAESFEALFGVLFSGGTGRLRLTDPDDPLESGVEIDARPAGKSLRGLALLSGGERSLAALAFLFAVFGTQRSPFYVLDEVDAALDDVNLHRFLNFLDEFRCEAQLLLVTHQRPTMEIADRLYGVTMRPGGTSTVIAEQRGGATELLPAANGG